MSTENEEKVVVPQPESNDRVRNSNEYSNFKEIDLDSDFVALVMPANTAKQINKLTDVLYDMTEREFVEKFNPTQRQIAGANINSNALVNKDDMLKPTLDNPEAEWVNEINYSDKKLHPSAIKVNASGKLTGNAALAAFSSGMGIGERITVPLWHSGIWVVLRPPKDSDLINLEMAISANEIRLGRETNTLVYSNYNVVFNRLVSNFIIAHIENVSVDLPDDVDIREIISVRDFYPLIAAFIKTMNPEGYEIYKSCINTLELNEDKTPVCDFKVSGYVDTLKLIRVNRKALDADMMAHMIKKRPKSMTYDEVKEYQTKIKDKTNNTHEFESDNGQTITLTYSMPSLARYIDNGELWIENIIADSQRLFTDSDDEDVKNKKVRDTLNSVILGVYNSFVSEIKQGDVFTDDLSTVNSTIDMLSGKKSILKDYLSSIKKYVESNTIAVVATSTFECPSCAKKAGVEIPDQTNGAEGVFKEFIPFNILEHFFDLSTLKIQEIKGREDLMS